MKAKKVSPAEFGRQVKLTRGRISQLIKSGQLGKAVVRVPGKKRILLDVKKGLDALGQLDPSQQRGQQSADGDLARERRKLIRARRKKIELEQKIKSGEYIEIVKVRDEGFLAARILREHFLNMPARISAIVAAKSKKNEQQIATILRREMRKGIEDFIKKINRVAASE
jgi:hypothetical protein